MMDKNFVQEARAAKAEAMYQGYEFGEGATVATANGWESSTGCNEWSRSVFVEYEGASESEKVGFHVHFQEGSDVVRDVWALNRQGAIVGHFRPQVPDSTEPLLV
ncbi:hypothetical protein LC612_40960 [Nostoc sp. CHAB 5834]|nr:hypothetical protein [Nostoc sp. CHAB 5834]